MEILYLSRAVCDFGLGPLNLPMRPQRMSGPHMLLEAAVFSWRHCCLPAGLSWTLGNKILGIA